MSSRPSPAVSAWPQLIPFSVTPSTDSPEVQLNYAIVLLGCLVFASLYVFPQSLKKVSLAGRKLYNQSGYATPNGPMGLPIVGSFIPTTLWRMCWLKCDLTPRILPIPNTLSRAHARLLVQKIWTSLLPLAWEPALCDCQRPRHRKGPSRHEWRCLFECTLTVSHFLSVYHVYQPSAEEGNVHQVSDCLCRQGYHRYSL